MSKKFLAIAAGLGLLILLVLFTTTYTVRFHEVAIRTRFGQTGGESIVKDAGLHWKLPVFADRITKLDTRLQTMQTPAEEIKTRDGQSLVVRAFLLWQVEPEGEGPLRFHEAFETPATARESLGPMFREQMKGTLGRFSFDEFIGEQSKLREIEDSLLASVAQMYAANGGNGVRAVTVGISQIQLPARTTMAVMERMEQTRKARSTQERSAGEADANRIRAQANSMIDKIRAVAVSIADEIRYQGDTKAAEYLAQMAQEGEDLAIFLVQLEMLKNTLSEYTTVVLPTNVAPWHLMLLESGNGSGSIPQPASAK